MEKDSAAKPKPKTARKSTRGKRTTRQPKAKTATEKEALDMNGAEEIPTADTAESTEDEEIPAEGPARVIQDTASEPGIDPKDIPVEDLANGITNALGEGLALAIDSSRSMRAVMAADARTGAKMAMSGATAGYGKLRDFVCVLTGCKRRDEADEGFKD